VNDKILGEGGSGIMSKPNSKDLERYIFKVVLLGDGAVGKTSLVRRFMEGKFRMDYLPTIGAQVYTKEVQEDEGANVTLVVWDISGQPAFSNIRSDYYKGAMGVVLMFDLTRSRTFEHLDGWLNEVMKYTNSPRIIVAGSKCDLEHSRKVLQKSGEEFASKIRAPYFETSAKDGKNVEKVFAVLAKALVKYSSQI
jgi:Ras-related protein Rab-8A